MIHPATELQFINADIGYGVVATNHIPKGTITWVQDALDREFTPGEVYSFPDAYRSIFDTYAFRNNKGNLVLCWDHARFVNHSFHANCMTTAYDFEVAIRDIRPGEQLTDDYGYLNIEAPFRALPEGSRRKVVYPDDLLKYHRIWDKKLESAFRCIPGQSQPLWEFLDEKTIEKIEMIFHGKEQMDSILNCYYNGKREVLG